jgi:hypothetical protein
MSVMPGTYNYQGQILDPVATENWLNAAGIYITAHENGAAEAHIDLGSGGLHGLFGEVVLPPTPTERMQFIDDPAWKHWLKFGLIALIVALVILNGYKLLK